MPIYEYRCKVCGNDFELLIRSSEFSVRCPQCGADSIVKKFSTFGFSTGNATEHSTAAHSSCGGCAGHNCSGCHH